MNFKPPHFICVGAQRSGTSWMYMCFAEHPDIFMPQKEMHFFDNEPLTQFANYCQRFSESDKVCGEITPDYLSEKDAVNKISQSCPETKIIVILRNPIERTRSSFLLYKERGVIDDENLDAVYSKKSDPYRKSLYGEQIEHLYANIPAENIKVVFFERVVSDPVGLLQELFTFIGVDPNFVPQSATRNFNASSIGFGNNKVAKLITDTQNYLIGRPWGRKLLSFKRTNWFKRFKNGWIKRSTQQQKSAESKSYYPYFAADIAKLEAKIGQAVPESWKKS